MLSPIRALTCALTLAAAGTAAAQQPALEALLPAGTEIVVSLNVEQMLQSGVGQKYMRDQLQQAMSTNAEAKQVMEATGLDFSKDVSRLTVAGAVSYDPFEVKQGVAVLQGRFDKAKVESAIREYAKKDDKLEVMDQGGRMVLKSVMDVERGGKKEQEEVYVTVADAGTVLAASSADLLSQTAAKLGGGEVAIEGTIKEAWGRLNPGKTLTLAIDPGDNLQNMPLPPQAEPLAKNLKALTLVVNLTDGVELEIGMGMKEQKVAADFGAQLKQILPGVAGFLPAIAAGQPEMQPIQKELAEFAKTFAADVDGQYVLIKANMSAELIEKFRKAGERMKDGPPKKGKGPKSKKDD